MKKVLITGTAGFIGYHLAHQLLSDGECQVHGVDNLCEYYPVAVKSARLEKLKTFGEHYQHHTCDICDYQELTRIFTDFKPDVVCNLAAQAGVRYSIENPFAYQESNIQGFLNILECCRHHSVERLVYASSSSVYGGNTDLPFSETDRVDTPVSLYAASKKANELMARCYSHLYEFQTVGLRFFTVYGPWGRPDMAMWIFAEKILHDEPIPVFNNGDMKRDFTFVNDIVAGIKNAMFKGNLDQYEIFNLGNHRCENLMDMIGIIESALGKKAQLDLLPIQPGDVPATFADISLSQKKLNFSPQTPIAEGIPLFCKWYQDHPKIGEDVHAWRKANGD